MGFFSFMSLAASAVIFVWATYCILAPCVPDGVIGKFFFSLAAVASLLDMMGAKASQAGSIEPKSLILIALAAIVVRHFAMKLLRTKAKRTNNVHNHT